MKKQTDARTQNPNASALSGELRVVLGKLIRRLREQADVGDLSSSQKSVLLHLEQQGPGTVTSLADALGVRPQSMGATVAALEAMGLIIRTADPSDGRRKLLSLSPEFQELVRAGRAAREDWLSSAIQQKFSTTEQKQLAASVELLKRLLD